jgi:5'-methylthioadenosine phosphorylase
MTNQPITQSIPQADYALIGGSGTWGARFPEDIQLDDVELVEVYKNGFETPYGRSAPFKLLTIAGKPVWRVAMHGMWRDDGSKPYAPWIAAKQTSWVMEQAGVKWALVEGSVGGIQSPIQAGAPLPPWSVVISTDFMVLWRPEDDNPFRTSRPGSARLNDPFCPILRAALVKAARNEPKFMVYEHGVYITTPWLRFETVAEIRAMAALGAHVVGHTLGHEMPLWRRLGIRVASLNLVSNHAEGFSGWSGESAGSMSDFYSECPHYVGPVMVNALKEIIEAGIAPPEDPSRLVGLGQFPVPGA